MNTSAALDLTKLDPNKLSPDQLRKLVNQQQQAIRELAVKANRGLDREVTVEFGKYKGNPTVTVKGPHSPCTFGLGKARSVVKVFSQIKDWVDRNDTLKVAGIEEV